jgi:hypothetical protein
VTEWLDVSRVAHELKIPPSELVREIVRDGVEVLQVSERRYRITGEAWELWKAIRKTRLAEEQKRGSSLADYVVGSSPSPRRPRFRRTRPA